MGSILSTVKEHLGGEMVATVFDNDIKVAINTVIATLKQLGVKTLKTSIEDTTDWNEVFPDISDLEAIKSYIGIKVKLYFDPPASGTLIDLYNSQLDELQWRINVDADPHWKGVAE